MLAQTSANFFSSELGDHDFCQRRRATPPTGRGGPQPSTLYQPINLEARVTAH